GDRVAERQDQHAPGVERVVEGEDRGLLASVNCVRRGEGGADLVRKLSGLPERPRLVDELLQLCGDVSETGRRSEGDAVRPVEVVQGGNRRLRDLRAMAAPVLVLRDQELRCELLYVP